MTTELKQAAQQAVDAFDAFGAADDFATLFTLTQKMNALRTAIQQAESAPVYWEWRHQGSHPDAVDFGQWSEWKRVEPRSALHTVEDALNEFRGYIARGHKYELRALYTHTGPGVPDDVARDAERWRTFLETRPSNTHEGIIAAIDAACAPSMRSWWRR